MQLVKKFMHPVHMVNYYNGMLKKILATCNPDARPARKIPYLSKEVGYYFTFASQARNELDKMLYAICCFAYDGEIIFSCQGSFDCSLWHYRRMGMAALAKKIEGTIRVQFKRHNVPLDPNNPFQQVDENLYWCNISWFNYNLLLKQ